MLIINADDYGLSSPHNEAILRCFRAGFCSSTTLMPNMPAFEEACQLAHEYKFIRHVGLHMVLQEGPPLTDKIKLYARFCDKHGLLKLSRRPIFYLSTIEKEVLADEIRAQIKRCRDYEIPLTHLDSHHHIHTEWAIVNVLIPIAREQNIPYIRLSRNCKPIAKVGLLKSLYKLSFNMKLQNANLARTKYFGSLDDYFYAKKGRTDANDSFEIMIHPTFDENKILVDGKRKINLVEVIEQVDGYKNAVSFTGAKYDAM